jgi:hydroxymethylpyrimidine kinase/phosphomethylpyrimidine kinase
MESRKPPRALTIAGSDSGGGAGIQADLKTFAALGVYGTSAITAITAQNTEAVTAVQDIDLKVIRAQIRAVVEDIGIDVVKTGMLHTVDVINTVIEEIRDLKVPIIVDPVMISKSGAELLREDAVEVLKKQLIPLATVLTPNTLEAEKLSGVEIHSLEDARSAAEILGEQGATAVVVKGGHLPIQDKVIDTFYYEGEIRRFESERIETPNTHGTGCVFASAIAAEIAKGRLVVEAVGEAKKFVSNAVKFSYSIGKGHGPVNSLAELYREEERYRVLREVREAAGLLEEHPEIATLIPETSSNIGMALSLPEDTLDVAAVPGRISKVERGVKAASCPAFGASNHIARIILTAMQTNPSIRAAMNIRYSEETIRICRKMKMIISSYDRAEEPPEVKLKEGGSTTWGTQQAIEKAAAVPDVIYHKGDLGKEPMIVLLGRNTIDIARTAILIAKKLTET